MRRPILILTFLLYAVTAAAEGESAPPAASASAAGAPASAAGAPASAAEAPASAAEAPASAAVAPASAAEAPASAAESPETTSGVEVAPPAAASAAPETGDDTYKLKIQELEARVNELKEQIFRSKSRLAILKETVLASSIAGAEARVVHRNEMGSSFKLEKVTYSLDGAQIFSRTDSEGKLDGQEQIEIFSGPIVPGNHLVSVVMVYRGNGYGIFSYLNGYVFTLRSSYTFRAEEGKLTRLGVVGFEKGGVTTDLKDRPAIRFDTELVDSRKAQQASEKRDGEDR